MLEGLDRRAVQGKEKLIEPNIKALNIGVDYVRENFECPLDIRVERRDLLGDKILYSGNSAVRSVRSTPVRPSPRGTRSRLRHRSSTRLRSTASKYRVDPETGKNNYAIVQAEDELAAIGMVMGACWNGARAFTATSGPGV